MSFRRSPGRSTWLGALIVLAVGCGGQDAATSTGTPEPAVATGKVTLKGKAPTGASVTFSPSSMNPNMKRGTVPVQPDGTFKFEGSAGPYSVTVRNPVIDRDSSLETNRKEVELKPGENPVTIEL